MKTAPPRRRLDLRHVCGDQLDRVAVRARADLVVACGTKEAGKTSRTWSHAVIADEIRLPLRVVAGDDSSDSSLQCDPRLLSCASSGEHLGRGTEDRSGQRGAQGALNDGSTVNRHERLSFLLIRHGGRSVSR